MDIVLNGGDELCRFRRFTNYVNVACLRGDLCKRKNVPRPAGAMVPVTCFSRDFKRTNDGENWCYTVVGERRLRNRWTALCCVIMGDRLSYAVHPIRPVGRHTTVLRFLALCVGEGRLFVM